MKAKFFCAVISLLVLSGVMAAQSGVEPTPTPVKVVITDSMPQQSTVEPTPTPMKVVITNSAPANSATVAPRVTLSPTPLPTRERVAGQAGPAVNSETLAPASFGASNIATRSFTFGQIKSKIAEAKRLLQSRPLATALVEGTAPTDYVRVAYQDSRNNRIDFFVLSKESFLDPKFEKSVSSENGRQLRVRTIRGNGVNTPIVVLDDQWAKS